MKKNDVEKGKIELFISIKGFEIGLKKTQNQLHKKGW